MKKINFLLLMAVFFAGIAFAQKPVFIGKIKDIAEMYKKKAVAAANNMSASEVQVSHLLPDNQRLVLKINSSRHDGTSTFFFGEVYNTAYSNFYLKITGSQVTGSVIMRKQKKFYRYSSAPDGSVYLTAEDIDKVICTGIPEAKKTGAVSGQHTASVSAAPPEHESLPGAQAVLYLDFDGQTVTNTLWNTNFNNGNPIVADPADLSESEMTEVWKLVSEDYRPFQINVTTKESVFNDAPADRRMRVIFTPTTYFYPGAGGVAYVGSFTWGGTSLGETPCWVFNTSIKGAGEAGSHEGGHTVGLRHDGRTSPAEEYFYGQDSWAPIMGVGYYVPVVQWSKGEYPNANNTEDDLSIITTANGFGYRADDYGNSIGSATPLVINSSGDVSSASNKGVISSPDDADVFSFGSTGGTASFTVNPDPDYPNLDVYLTVRDADNDIVATSDPSSQSASLDVSLGSGTYYLTVDGTRGSLGANSDYGSLGAYSISGTVPANTNKPPVVSITSPSDGAIYTAPATISITATASDGDGTVSYVEFYNGMTLLKKDSIIPYRYTLKNAGAGTYSITAKAIDDLGLSTTSSVVTIIVNANKAPTVNITSPPDNTVYPAPATFTVNAAANDSDGSISYVQFYNLDTLLSTDSTSPYSYTFSNAKAGNYTLTAKAVDNNNRAAASDTVHILVGNNKLPAVKITSPGHNTFYSAPAAITLSATATDADGTISVVKFYNGGTLLGIDSTSPYSYTLTNPAAGNYSFVAKATDNNGGRGLSASVAVVVLTQINKAPLVSITSPANNVVYNAGANIVINVAASDSDGSVTKVRFYNGGTLLATDNTSPYICTISNLSAGNYSLVAKATDNNGLTSSSSSVAVAVSVAPNKAPVVSLTNPARNGVYAAGSTIDLIASASDADGSITSVQFYSGATLLQTDSTAPYTYTLTNAAARTYSITAKATDNHGLFSSSASVVFTVSALVNNAPIVSITRPANNATYNSPATVTIHAAASDADGSISNVQFYRGSTLLRTDSTSPYSYTLRNLAAGTYSITAKATDNTGLFSSSASTAIIVAAVPNKAPIVSITSPDSNSVYTAPATITINASASDSDGTISNVKFYNGTTYLATVNTSPYTYTLSNLAAGNYSFTATATDNNGAETISAVVRILVKEPNKAPAVSITSPVNNATYTAPAAITINALAADADGTVSNVKFYNGTTLLKTVSASPYTYTLSNLAPGTYTFTAKATDDLGAQTTSAAVKVKVVNASIVGNKPYSQNQKTALNDALRLGLSPNPANNIVNISTNGLQLRKPATLSIISVSGNVLKTMRINNSSIQLDVSSLVSGVYTVKIINADKLSISSL